ncbi:MAG TPA: GMC family oxidoreductase N-terminal domain-containing protein [Solirubrobacteraceae bacterium]|nr:GMC family oxidoreductase N-terminal domain-containing protein [Solirubrobacteraceae bacterium]
MSEHEVYDYVIVGAGSAGCVLAARLSEDRDARVALLEAGGEDSQPEIHIPAAFPALFKSSFDWDLLGEQEPGLGNRRLYLPRGRMLGGCSSINAMIYIRGNRADYDGWGIEGWSYDDVLPYFKRSEDNERGEDAFHGAGGPMKVADSRSMQPLVETMLEAAQAAGHEHNPDFNGARQEGVGRFQLTQRGGWRESTADAFLRPAAERPNLEVIPRAMALRIVFEGDRAVGVQIARDGRVYEVRAEREVILAAGSYQSPVLLMLSGIGPEDQLAPFGIEIREQLPVGHNLQDHCMAQLNYLTDEPSLFMCTTPENIELLESEGRGPLTSNIPEAAGFFRTRPGLEAPDVQFHFAPSMFFDEGLTAPADHGYCFGPVVIHPTSRGRVMLRAPLPDSKPRVLCNFLTTEEDRASMLAGMRMALAVAAQPALKAVERAPFSVPASDSETDLWAFIERVSQSVYHPTSTCAIGSVVDHDLRVYGCEGLRVVDASVMPRITRGNTNAPTIMIAERAADLIAASAGAQAAAGVP